MSTGTLYSLIGKEMNKHYNFTKYISYILYSIYMYKNVQNEIYLDKTVSMTMTIKVLLIPMDTLS